MIEYGLVLPVAYLLGSVSWGLIVGRLTRGVDVREHGSGATGMTNVLRILGVRWALLVMMADISKGVIAVLLARWIVGAPLAEALAGVLVILGHNWPVFSGFRGGRGVTTGVGGLAVMSPLAAGLAVGMFVVTIAITRYVSLGSVLAVITAMVAIPVLVAIGQSPGEYLIYIATGAPLIIGRHQANILRLLRGTERRLGQREEAGGDGPPKRA